MTQFVKLPNGQVVNPAYVTAIERDGPFTKVWVVKDSGYGTGSYEFAGNQVDKLRALLEGGQDKG